MRQQRRAGVYIAVLGASLIIAVIGVSALTAVRVQRRAAEGINELAEARLYAQSAVELGLFVIESDPNWRTNRTRGRWASDVKCGAGYFHLEVDDPVDGDLADSLADPLVLTGIGYRGRSRYKLEVRLAPEQVPLDALRTAIHTAGQLHIRAGKTLTIVGGGPASTNGELRNDGLIVGNVEAGSITGGGSVAGTTTLGGPPKPMPDAGVVASYVARGTAIAPPNDEIDTQALGPGYNPWGSPNADGVYVLNVSSDVVIRDARILGTLVVVAPGNSVTLSGAVLIQNYRNNYPALIVDADLLSIESPGGLNLLSETLLGVNFNPPGVPYAGSTDSDMLDLYPSEIRGLIHCRGAVEIRQNATVNGTIIAESSSSGDAVDVNASPTINYDPSLYTTNTPDGYTQPGPMRIVAGSWRQVVD